MGSYRASATQNRRFVVTDPSTGELVTPDSTPVVNLVTDGTVGASMTVSGGSGDYSVAMVIGAVTAGTHIQGKVTYVIGGVTRVAYPTGLQGTIELEALTAGQVTGAVPTAAAIVAAIEGEAFGALTLQAHLDGILTAVGTKPSAAQIAAAVEAEAFGALTIEQHFAALSDSIDGAFADVYHAEVTYQVDDANSIDEVTVIWKKNGVRVTSGLTGTPALALTKWSDGTTHMAAGDMTLVTAGVWKMTLSGANRLTAGAPLIAFATAVIDGNSREQLKTIARDTAA